MKLWYIRSGLLNNQHCIEHIDTLKLRIGIIHENAALKKKSSVVSTSVLFIWNFKESSFFSFQWRHYDSRIDLLLEYDAAVWRTSRCLRKQRKEEGVRHLKDNSEKSSSSFSRMCGLLRETDTCTRHVQFYTGEEEHCSTLLFFLPEIVLVIRVHNVVYRW